MRCVRPFESDLRMQIGELVLRLLLALPLLLAGCGPSGDRTSHGTIDINAAAEAGRNYVANHAAIATGDGDTPASLPTPIASPACRVRAARPAPGGLAKDGVVAE